MSNPTTVEVKVVLTLSWGCDKIEKVLYNSLKVIITIVACVVSL